MPAVLRIAAAASAALLLALLGGCATADPLGQSGGNATVDPNPAPDPEPEPGPGPDPGPGSDPEPEPEPQPEPQPPVETNEVRLTWVETGGASRVILEYPFGLPYTAHFEVHADGPDKVTIESIALDPSGTFSVSNDGCTGTSVTSEQGCAISLDFVTDTVGVYETVLRVKPVNGPQGSIPVLIEVVDEEVDPDTEGTDTEGTDTEGTEPDGQEGAPPD